MKRERGGDFKGINSLDSPMAFLGGCSGESLRKGRLPVSLASTPLDVLGSQSERTSEQDQSRSQDQLGGEG